MLFAKLKITPGEIDGNLQEAGFDETLLIKAFRRINFVRRKVHSVLVFRRKKLVAEWNTPGYGVDVAYPLFSIAKSITSILVGIAIEMGYIEDERSAVLDFFPEFRSSIDDAAKFDITIKHILTQTSGIRWRELDIAYKSSANMHYGMEHSSDWMEFVLSQPMEHCPGEVFEYNTGAFHLFSAIIERASGMKFEDFADKHLFTPLGIEEIEWKRDPCGFACAAGSVGGVSLTPMDLAKIGWMVIDGGEFNGRRIVDTDWLDRSTVGLVDTLHGAHYGYGWWVWHADGIKIFAAKGYAGQALMIVPELDLFVVFTGNNIAKKKRYDAVFKKILSAIES